MMVLIFYPSTRNEIGDEMRFWGNSQEECVRELQTALRFAGIETPIDEFLTTYKHRFWGSPIQVTDEIVVAYSEATGIPYMRGKRSEVHAWIRDEVETHAMQGKVWPMLENIAIIKA